MLTDSKCSVKEMTKVIEYLKNTSSIFTQIINITPAQVTSSRVLSEAKQENSKRLSKIIDTCKTRLIYVQEDIVNSPRFLDKIIMVETTKREERARIERKIIDDRLKQEREVEEARLHQKEL